MPGNQTIYKSARANLPVVWTDSNLPVNANRIMEAAGLPIGMNQIPVATAGSVTSIVGLLSEVVTNGTLTVELVRNGTDTGQQLVFTTTDPVTKVMTVAPGTIDLAPNDTVGLRVSTSTPFAPAGVVDVVVYVEVQSV